MISHLAPTQRESKANGVFSRIWVKIMLAVGVAVCSVMTVFIINIEKRSYEHAQQDIASQQKLITEGQAVLLSEYLYESDSLATFQILSGILANPFIEGVRVDYHNENEPIILGDVDGGLPYTLDINHFDETSDQLYRIATITTLSTTRFLEQTFLERSKQLMLMVLAVLMSILLITAVCIHYFVGVPLGKIVANIRATNNNNPMPIDWVSRDEMGYVVKQLNFLHEQQRNRESGLKQELNDSEEREKRRINSLVNATLEGIIILKDQVILEINEPMADLLGSPIESLMGQPVSEVFSPEIVGFLGSECSGDEALQFESDIQYLNAADNSTTTLHVEIHLRPLENGTDHALVAVFRDVTARVLADREMRYLAHYDSLTGLPNRSHFMGKLDNVLEVGCVANRDFAIMYVDLDYFKQVNDTRGHEAGDDVLRHMGDIFRDLCDERHFAARLGGDEFAVIYNCQVPDEGIEYSESVQPIVPFNPQHFAQHLLSRVAQCREALALDNKFGVSIGIAVQPKDTVIHTELLTQADEALYASKAEGRNTYTIFKADPPESDVQTLAM